MEIRAAMLADAATSLEGKLYVHGGGWDTLAVRDFPVVHPSFAVAILLSADASEAPGTGELRVQLVDADGVDAGVGATGLIGVGQGPFSRPGQRTPVPIALTFPSVRFEKPGQYEFRVSWNDQQLSPSVTFFVNKIQGFSQPVTERHVP